MLYVFTDDDSHPFCATSVDQYYSWNIGKRRAAEVRYSCVCLGWYKAYNADVIFHRCTCVYFYILLLYSCSVPLRYAAYVQICWRGHLAFRLSAPPELKRWCTGAVSVVTHPLTQNPSAQRRTLSRTFSHRSTVSLVSVGFCVCCTLG